jgi:hypothetical protein
MPVYNAGRHLAEAVESILHQSHEDFELLAIDDGSTDDSGAYLDSVDDPRVRVIHQENRGLTGALNVGIAAATHELVARMDQDDFSYPERLRLQAAALVERPTLAAIACCHDVMDESGRHIGVVHVPAEPAYLARQLHFRNVLPHGGMMFRKSAVVAAGGYRDVGPAEDYDLWSRLAVSESIGSLPQQLIRYRVTATGMSQTGTDKQRAALQRIRADLHSQRPLLVPSPARLVRDGLHITQAQQQCPDLAASYLFDHTGLAVQLARSGRVADAARLLAGVCLFALRLPRALKGLLLFGHRRSGPPVGESAG